MIRDFTEDAKNTLYDQIDSVAPQGAVGTTADFFGDLGYEVQSWLGQLCIDNYIDHVDDYHNRILDKNNTSKQQIDEIFTDVSAVEADYEGRLKLLSAYLANYTSYFERLGRMIEPWKIPFLQGASSRLQESIGNRADMILDLLMLGQMVAVDDDMRLLLEQRLEEMTADRYSGKADISKMEGDEIKKLVYLYEFLYPDTGARMDEILSSGANNTLTKEDINKIKYIAYTAPEPYRSVYLGYVGSYEIGSFGGRVIISKVESNNYNKYMDRVYFVDALTAFSEDPRGQYTIWFHESGHATDSNAQKGLDFYCMNFSTYSEAMGMETTLQDAIYYDVYNDIEEKIRLVAGEDDDVDVDKILDSFRYGGDEGILSGRELEIRDNVIAIYSAGGADDLTGTVNEAASDVYGGVTNLVIDVGYGHRPVREKGETDEEYQKKIDHYRYWYDIFGNATYSQSKELFAEYFSYYMTGNEAAIESMRNHFPAASEVMDEMVAAMAEDLEEAS